MATTLAPTREGLRDVNIPLQFKNEPSVDFSNPESARRMRAAIEKIRNELGREYDLVIGGRRVKTAEKTTSLNPAKPSEIVGVHQAAGAAEVEPAMQAALKAFETWKYASVEERTGLLFRTSALMRERKFELMAWMVFEVGKNWAEADGDIAELIDFCDLYALEAIRLSKAEPPVQLPGERDWLRYIPLGVGVVIPPWNFPGAIMGGMTLASIVCGNTVILKPSSDSPTIAAKFFEILEEAGLPDGVANFCPGHGNSFGNAIVEHPKTRYIAFTGSKEVGLHINRRAAEQQPGQIWIKRTVLEMGGKDSIVVDADADLDAAVEGIAVSAFDCRIEIGVGVHHNRILAAHLEDGALDPDLSGLLLRRATIDVQAHFLRSGERDVARFGVLDDSIAEAVAMTGAEVDYAVGQAGFFQYLEELCRDGRRIARGLQDDGVAAHDGRKSHAAQIGR